MLEGIGLLKTFAGTDMFGYTLRPALTIDGTEFDWDVYMRVML